VALQNSDRSQGVLVFARKVQVDVIGLDEARACPIAWMDSFCMRSFTGREAFDETLPVADGKLEVSFQIDLESLRVDMEDWLTKKFGEGKPVQLKLVEIRW
jgi:hypothetical protein